MKTARIEIADSPLRPAAGPTSVFYRETGAGTPLLFLHGGWGYEIYPFDRQIEALRDRFRILIPDRSGYGRSSGIDSLPADFHRRAAGETLRFLDALGVEQAVLWGHSDGAVIAAMCGLSAPGRVIALILEAFHFQSAKHGSLPWMRSVLKDPDSLNERTQAALTRDHGEGWRKVVENNARAWIEIAEVGGAELYGGRLPELTPPALFIIGQDDQRTEPGDPEFVRQALPKAEIQVIEGARHSPHSESASAGACGAIATRFLDKQTYS